MKQKITNPDKDIELLAKEKSDDHEASHSAEIEALNMYLLVYSYPFVPMMDLTIVFVELIKMVKYWFLNKRGRKIIYKKKTHEKI